MADGVHSVHDSDSVAAVCAKLGLTPLASGGFIGQGDDRHILLLPVGEIWPWQKADSAVRIIFLAGAPAALSWSANGHDAEAAHLGRHLPHHKPQENLAAACWMTAESLGQWSLLALHAATQSVSFTAAPDDWFPTPMATPQGRA